jgi:hypothetical protein
MGSARRGGDKSHHLPCLSSPYPVSWSPVVCTAATAGHCSTPELPGSLGIPASAVQLQYECSSWVGFPVYLGHDLWRLYVCMSEQSLSRHGLCACCVPVPRRSIHSREGKQKRKKVGILSGGCILATCIQVVTPYSQSRNSTLLGGSTEVYTQGLMLIR